MKTKKQEKLPKKFKAKLIKALLSGEFVQTSGVMVKTHIEDESHKHCCCLGVAGFVAGHDEVQIRHSCYNYFPNGLKKVPKILHTPDSHTYDPNQKPRTVGEKLASMNDNGKTFKQIATYIKKYL